MTLATPGAGHGLVLVRGSAKASARWLRRGLVAVACVTMGATASKAREVGCSDQSCAAYEWTK